MKRFWTGALWGAIATIAMSALMILGLVTGLAPMPKPIPAAIVGKIRGGGLPRPALMGRPRSCTSATARSGAAC